MAAVVEFDTAQDRERYSVFPHAQHEVDILAVEKSLVKGTADPFKDVSLVDASAHMNMEQGFGTRVRGGLETSMVRRLKIGDVARNHADPWLRLQARQLPL